MVTSVWMEGRGARHKSDPVDSCGGNTRKPHKHTRVLSPPGRVKAIHHNKTSHSPTAAQKAQEESVTVTSADDPTQCFAEEFISL